MISDKLPRGNSHAETKALPKLHKRKIEIAVQVALHILTWSYVFLSPLLFRRNGEPMEWDRFLHGSTLPLGIFITFYINYFVLIPRFFLVKGKLKWFLLANLLIYLVIQTVMEYQGINAPPPEQGGHDAAKFMRQMPPKIYFVTRTILIFIFAIGASVALQLSLKWRQSEQARAEAELGRSQAELKNLKNQINPHFLLNALNNIYALTAFDQDKAQQAILELSKLLRYMLYENQTERVSLKKEMEFLESYIALMRLRLYNNVDVQVNFDFPDSDRIKIAPLIFISLVENAFKHGVSSTQKSYIHINLKADEQEICFSCVNSNFPKNESDKAPGGIGLKQVESRLEYSYPAHYTWYAGVSDDGKEYRSIITITEKTIKA